MPDGSLYASKTGLAEMEPGFSYVAIAAMPKKIPISLGVALILWSDELYDQIQLGLEQDHEAYCVDFCAWISAKGFHIEITHKEFECEHSFLSH